MEGINGAVVAHVIAFRHAALQAAVLAVFHQTFVGI